MSAAPSSGAPAAEHWQIRVRGTVQGVGFRPTVWRVATELGLAGEVLNDGEGVLVRLGTSEPGARSFLDRLKAQIPPLAVIEGAELLALETAALYSGFRIVPSAATGARTPVTPDAYTCHACRAEIEDPAARRHRYPFTNCTHCGPRFTIVLGIPYDRARTTMAPFPLCDECRTEYETPSDRRFHAQPIACPACGPRAWLVRADGGEVAPEEIGAVDAVDAAARLLATGAIVAIRGIGGFHLACDATRAPVVERLRARKHRDAKPFALMARDVEVIRRHCRLSPLEEELLCGPAAPIVLLERLPGCPLPAAVAPGLATLGFMLPTTPLHHLLLRDFDHPVVMTSGNLSSEPPVTDNAEVPRRLGGIADHALIHDREIANRIDDSVLRVAAGRPRVLRRARGYAPRPLPLPPGFESADGIVAHGGELKSTFCLVKEGMAILSPHQGDLEDAATYDQYVRDLDLLAELFEHRATHRAADLHPEYLSTKLARARSETDGLPLLEIQHHHAHTAACLAENGVPLDSRPVLGISLDGLGYGDDGTLWGGEFLLADYRGYRRVATFKPVVMIGGAQAVYEPWRNAYAHLVAALGWPRLMRDHRDLDLCRFLETKPRAALDRMIAAGINSPPASSCGRLFDAAAAAMGLCRERAAFEGQAAMELEALVDPAVATETLAAEDGEDFYPFDIVRSAEAETGARGSTPEARQINYLDPRPLWLALLEDLHRGTPPAVMAVRFHRGLARSVALLALEVLADPVAAGEVEPTAVLSGGCFQNRILLELTIRELEARGLRVLTHTLVPANDGGLSLGQAAIAAARLIEPRRR